MRKHHFVLGNRYTSTDRRTATANSTRRPLLRCLGCAAALTALIVHAVAFLVVHSVLQVAALPSAIGAHPASPPHNEVDSSRREN
jgi:hypothetical protein